MKNSILIILLILSLLYFSTLMLLNVSSALETGKSLNSRNFENGFRDFFQHANKPVCKEKTNFVFIKCMKCATETMASIFRRYGYIRNLNFVLPVKRNLYLGWPFPIEKSDIRSSKYEYNILMEHSIYNKTFMKDIMPNDTVFITSIRSPWEHFKSTYNYFAVGEIGNVPNEDVSIYLSNISYYNDFYMSPEKNNRRYCIPEGFSITRNLQSHCLGFPLGFPKGREDIGSDLEAIQKYIKVLADEFSLVIIVDHFAESLVLLKRVMCWSFKDIVYHHSNAGNYKDGRTKTLKPEGPLFEIHKNWSHVDYILFDHFNKTLWKKIIAEGTDFYDELQQFKLIQLLVERFCFVETMWKFPESFITIPSSKFDSTFNVTGEDCSLMNTYMLPMLWAKFYQQEGLEPEDLGDTQNRPKPKKGCSI